MTYRDGLAANVRYGSHSFFDFCFTMKPGDLVIVSDTTERRQVWEVAGDYDYVDATAAPLNDRHQRQARLLDMDPNELWVRAGGRLVEGQINLQTLGGCAEVVE